MGNNKQIETMLVVSQNQINLPPRREHAWQAARASGRIADVGGDVDAPEPERGSSARSRMPAIFLGVLSLSGVVDLLCACGRIFIAFNEQHSAW